MMGRMCAETEDLQRRLDDAEALLGRLRGVLLQSGQTPAVRARAAIRLLEEAERR